MRLLCQNKNNGLDVYVKLSKNKLEVGLNCKKGNESMDNENTTTKRSPATLLAEREASPSYHVTAGESPETIMRKIGGTTYIMTGKYKENGEELLDKLWRLIEYDAD